MMYGVLYIIFKFLSTYANKIEELLTHINLKLYNDITHMDFSNSKSNCVIDVILCASVCAIVTHFLKCALILSLVG